MVVSPPGLITAIAKSWDHLEPTFDSLPAWGQFSAELLRMLRQFDDPEADQDSIARQILRLFTVHPKANAVLCAELAGGFDALEPGPGLGSPWNSADSSRSGRIRIDRFGPKPEGPLPDRHVRVTVLYGSDRKGASAIGEPVRYSAEAGETLSFGIAEVSVPDDHRKGKLERPRWYRLEFRENPAKHVVLTGLRALDHDEFVATARETATRDGTTNDALIFVHGYKVGFEDAILRTAQLVNDLDFHGIGLAYSWPSEGKLLRYGADANASESSMFPLADFIRIVQGELGVGRVHLIAHSMGSRLVARAMDRLSHNPPPPEAADVHQLVFAAPDIDPKTFERFAQAFLAHCERCTLYASSRDLALFASRLLYRHERAGDTSLRPCLVRGVDTIDATNVDSSLLGHSYFGDRRTVVADLFDLINTGHGPEKRFGLREVPLPEGRYWEFVP